MLALAFTFLLLPSVAKAESTATPAAHSGLSAAKKGKRLAKQSRNVLPDSPKDLTDSDDGLDGTSAETSTRHDQDTPWLTTTTTNAIALQRPGLIPAFLFSTHSSDSLHEHIRERAPPPSRRSPA